ncbi:hypothetical protein B0G57_101648 [Trinickia symbiotica]|nr:hypothetical protein [Trinickia symbiotica]PPK47680.1 hypothetical protein B0G57_101648 [Trinickia symbiotica]
MKQKMVLAVAVFVLSTTAFAGGPAPGMNSSIAANANGGVSGALGIGGFAVSNDTTSTVNGNYSASMYGPGQSAGSFTAGNQSFANTAVTFGTNAGFTNTHSITNTNSGNGNNGVTSTYGQNNFTNTGFSISSNTGSEDFGTSTFSAKGAGDSDQSGWADATGSSTANADGFVGVAGAGFGSFGSFEGSMSKTGFNRW